MNKKLMSFMLPPADVKLIIEALQARASRLEAYERWRGASAPRDARAAAMRKMAIDLQRVMKDEHA